MANQLTRYATVATVDTADQGYFIGVTIQWPVVGTGAVAGTSNQIRVTQFVLPFRVKVGKIVVEISTGSASGKMGIALYDANSNLVLESGAIATDSTGTITTSITAVTLEPGVYFFADTADNTTVAVRKATTPSQINTMLNINTVQKSGLGANASSGAIFPATIGAISALTVGPTLTLFEP